MNILKVLFNLKLKLPSINSNIDMAKLTTQVW